MSPEPPKDHVLQSVREYLSRKELLGWDIATKKPIDKPLYTFDEVIYRFYVPVKFFQDNGLLTRKLVDGPESVTEDFEWRRNDVTELGSHHFRTGRFAWLRALHRRGGKEGVQKFIRSPKADQIYKNHLKKLKEKYPDLK